MVMSFGFVTTAETDDPNRPKKLGAEGGFSRVGIAQRLASIYLLGSTWQAFVLVLPLVGFFSFILLFSCLFLNLQAFLSSAFLILSLILLWRSE